MLPQISENFNWPKTAPGAGLTCCPSEGGGLALETMPRESVSSAARIPAAGAALKCP